MIRLEEFRNALCILTSLDAPDLEAAGVIRRGDHAGWNTFRRDPFQWFVHADDATARALFTLIERRQSPMFATTEGLRNDTDAAP